jgi:hypothetical protein
MTRPGALESKKRCHDLIHRECDEKDFYKKKYAFSGRSSKSIRDEARRKLIRHII